MQNSFSQPFSERDQIFEKHGGFRRVAPALDETLLPGRVHNARCDQPPFKRRNIGKQFGGTLSEDWAGIQEIENRPIADEEKTIDPFAGFLGRSTHLSPILKIIQGNYDTSIDMFNGVVYPLLIGATVA